MTRLLKTSLFTLLALAALAAGGCRRGGPRHENANAWQWKGVLAAPATLNIRNTLGEIDVEPSTSNEVEVVASTSWSRGNPDRDLKFQAVTAENALTICAIWTQGECSPQNYSSQSNSGSGIHLSWSNKTDARVHFTVRVPAGVRVDVVTVSGDITVRASGPVKARSVDGDIKVGTAAGPVNAETLNGDVDVRMTTLAEAGEVRAATTNGDAVAYVPEIADGKIDARTMNGEVGSDFGRAEISSQRVGRKIEWVLGAGARQYTVRSMNGSAWLRLINPDGSVNAKKLAKTP